MPFRILPILRSQVLRAAIGGIVVAIAFCYMLARYWAFYHLGVGGGAVFVVLLPLAIVVSAVGAITMVFACVWRQIPAGRGVWISVGTVAFVATLLFAGEIHRTQAARSGEGIGAGDLAPFFRSLITLW